METIDIRPDDLEFVLHILAAYVPNREIWAFGSRVSDGAKEFSDLDLAILGDDPIPSGVLADLRETFRESNLPFKVDLIDWATTREHFRRIIDKEHVVIYGVDRVATTETRK